MKALFKKSIIVALLFAATFAQAQTVSPVDFMRMNPYQMKSNPATELPYISVMGLFLGNIGLDVRTSTLRYDNLFEFDADGRPASVNLRQFANSLKKSNYLGCEANVNLLTVYRRLEKGLVTFNYGVRMQSDIKFNDGLFKLLGYGNGAFVGENNPVEVNLDVDAMAYQELALGYQIKVNDKLFLGGRAKLLLGMAYINTDVFNAKLYTDPDSYALRVEDDIAMRMSVPRVLYAEDGKLMTDGLFNAIDLFLNAGFGVDLGAEYRFDDKFSAVASINDLGFIHWGLNNMYGTGKVNNAGQYYDDGGFLFNGLDVDQLQLVISDDSYRELFIDTLKQYFQMEFVPLEAHKTWLNTNVLLRGNYDLNAYNRVSAQLQARFMGNGFRPAMTLAYSGSFFKAFDVCATYTMMKGSFDNVGLGLSVCIGTLHIYATTNNVIGLFKPFNTSGMNVQAGVVFNLRRPIIRFSEYN